MSDRIRVCINGAGGRMGRRVTALTHADEGLALVAALEAADSPFLGADAGALAGVGEAGVPISAELMESADVVIDFSVPESLCSIAAVCAERQIALVAATTGLSSEQLELVKSTAQMTPVVFAPSMSLAVNLTMKLVAEAARSLKDHPAGVDVEVIERHHRFKEDAPSGTALRFGRLIADEMGQTRHVHGREGRPGKRPHGEIGYHAIRTGDNVGEHTIVFGLLGETMELTVRGHTRDSYAHGALAAARFVIEQGPGLYSMNDVLGL